MGAGSSDIYRAGRLAGNQVAVWSPKSAGQASNFESHAGFLGCSLEAKLFHPQEASIPALKVFS